MPNYPEFGPAILQSIDDLVLAGEKVDTGRWQGIATEGKPDLVTKEILNLRFGVDLMRSCWPDAEDWQAEMAFETGCNAEWADEHFAERVGGKPLNPDPSHERWPWWRGQDAETKQYGEFSHTYSERFWPKEAGLSLVHRNPPEGDGSFYERHPMMGIRYRFGDYTDVLTMLEKDPYTRQAYLPIFFPEDTGAVHGGRIPCSLGYHFLLRNGKLHMWYDIRSCDAVRHFRDDLYLAARLQAHTLQQLFDRELRSDAPQLWVDVELGYLYFSCHSFHVHMGDYHLL